MQVLMLGTVVAVWVLIYCLWREVDIFILEQDGESPPQNLFEILERREITRIIPIPGGVIIEDELRTRQS